MNPEEYLTETVWRRHNFLSSLSSEQKTKEELADTLDCTQQNIYKRGNELKEKSLIEYNEGEYSLTLYGKLVLERYNELNEITEYEDLLTTKSIHKEIDPKIIYGAEFLHSNSTLPEKVFRYIDRELEDCELLEGFTCTLFSPNRVKTYIRAMQEYELDIKGVIHSRVMDYLLSEHSDEIPTVEDSGKLTAWITDEHMPYSLLLLDRSKVIILIFNTDTDIKNIISIKGLIVNDSNEAVNWAKYRFEEYKKDSKKVELNELTKKEPGY